MQQIKQILADAGIRVDDPNELKTKLKAMTGAQALDEEYKQACGDLTKVKQILDALHQPGKSAEEILETCPPTLTGKAENDAPKPANLEDAQKVIARQFSQNKLLTEKLKDQLGGRGLVYPPCWIRPNTTDFPIYTYNVHIRDAGLFLTNGDDRTGMDLTAINENGPEPDLGVVISTSEFHKKTSGMYNWSVKNECRFFVRIMDNTATTNKEGYKRMLASIENNFYKYLVK